MDDCWISILQWVDIPVICKAASLCKLVRSSIWNKDNLAQIKFEELFGLKKPLDWKWKDFFRFYKLVLNRIRDCVELPLNSYVSLVIFATFPINGNKDTECKKIKAFHRILTSSKTIEAINFGLFYFIECPDWISDKGERVYLLWNGFSRFYLRLLHINFKTTIKQGYPWVLVKEINKETDFINELHKKLQETYFPDIKISTFWSFLKSVRGPKQRVEHFLERLKQEYNDKIWNNHGFKKRKLM